MSYAGWGLQITCHAFSDVPVIQFLSVGSAKFSHGARGDGYNDVHCISLSIAGRDKR